MKAFGRWTTKLAFRGRGGIVRRDGELVRRLSNLWVSGTPPANLTAGE